VAQARTAPRTSDSGARSEPIRLQRCRSASGGCCKNGLAASLTAMTSRPCSGRTWRRCDGQLALMAVGALGVLTGVRKSWLRRFACVAWSAAFRFGIAVPFMGRACSGGSRLRREALYFQYLCYLDSIVRPNLGARSTAVLSPEEGLQLQDSRFRFWPQRGQSPCSLLCKAYGWAGREAPVRARHLQAKDRSSYKTSGLSLEDVVREQVLLSLPSRTLCKEDCKGLCPRCGQNLNLESCSCNPSREITPAVERAPRFGRHDRIQVAKILKV